MAKQTKVVRSECYAMHCANVRSTHKVGASGCTAPQHQYHSRPWQGNWNPAW